MSYVACVTNEKARCALIWWIWFVVLYDNYSIVLLYFLARDNAHSTLYLQQATEKPLIL